MAKMYHQIHSHKQEFYNGTPLADEREVNVETGSMRSSFCPRAVEQRTFDAFVPCNDVLYCFKHIRWKSVRMRNDTLKLKPDTVALKDYRFG
jgi:hypothetical protein